MSKSAARTVAILVGFVISSPVGFLLFHKPEAAGWGLDPWLVLGALAGAPGILFGSVFAGQNRVAQLAVSFLVCWLFYGTICYLLILCFLSFRRKL